VVSAKKLSRLWPTLESLPGLAAVTAEWCDRLGPEYDLAKVFLKPTDQLALAYPCAGPGGCGGSCRVVVHGPSDVVAVCEDCGTTRKLTKADRVVWRVNVDQLLRSVASTLSLTADPVATREFQTYRVGTFVAVGKTRLPVYLTIQLDPDRLARAATWLRASFEGPLVLLAPTRALFGGTPEDAALKGKVAFGSLDELVGGGTKELAALDGADGLLRDACAAVLGLSDQKKPAPKKVPKRASRAATIDALKLELHNYILGMKSRLSQADEAGSPFELPALAQKDLAIAIGATKSSVSRALGDGNDPMLDILLKTANSEEMIRKYSR